MNPRSLSKARARATGDCRVWERAGRMGANLKLWSEGGAGTEVELIIPTRIVYGTAHRRKRLRLFRKNKVGS